MLVTDVGYLLVTSLGRVMPPKSTAWHQHHILVYYDVDDRLECRKMQKMSHTLLPPTSSNGHHHNDVTKITVTLNQL